MKLLHFKGARRRPFTIKGAGDHLIYLMNPQEPVEVSDEDAQAVVAREPDYFEIVPLNVPEKPKRKEG